MSNSEYVELERQIAQADARTIKGRWKYGRRLLLDSSRTLANGRLRHGATADLIFLASDNGYKLSEAELQRRMLCARQYETEKEIEAILAEFSTWSDLIVASFPKPSSLRSEGTYPTVGEDNAGQGAEDAASSESPLHEGPYDDGGQEESGRPYDPRRTRDIERSMKKHADNMANAAWQTALSFGPAWDAKFHAESTLREMKKYADEYREWTARHEQIAENQDRLMEQLIAAVEGDMTKTWREAEEALAELTRMLKAVSGRG